MKPKLGVALKKLLLATLLVLGIGSASVTVAQSYRPSFHPDELDDRPIGSANEVMVLGSPHLSQLPDSFRLEMVEPLVSRLVAWRPTAVAVEDSSGLICDTMRRQPARYSAADLKSSCFNPAMAGQATGLDVPAANAEVERMLAAWPEEPTAQMRRRLAIIFLAAGEPTSASVQWLRLSAAERRAEDALTAELAAFLDRRTARKNESDLIGAQVAARSGLERVWSVDDQTNYAGDLPDEKAYGAALMSAWDNPATKAREVEGERLKTALGHPDGLLNMYRAYNAPSYPVQAYRSDWGSALTEPSPEAYGRRYVSYWETRNLRMVANMREVLGRRPGTRMLTIVGASHKAYYKAYLTQMRDVTLVDVGPVFE